MGEHNIPNIEKETIVVSTEQGMVLTGNRMEALEARIMESIRKPFYIVALLLLFMFVMMLGLGILIGRLNSGVTHLNDTANNTDQIITKVTGPEYQASQRKVVEDLISGFDCANQRNLQRFITELNTAGVIKEVPSVTFVEDRCKTP